MKNIKVALLKDDDRIQEIFDYIISLFDILTKGQVNCTWTDFGKAAYEKEGDVLPPSAISAMKQSDAALMGLIDKTGASHGSPVGKMRTTLGLYADIRPVHSFDTAKPFDMVFIRESTEGFLADRNCFAGIPEFMPTEDVALSVRVISRKASMKIARYAFDYAVKNGRKAILAAHKSNVLTLTCKLFLECFYETAREYPGIKASDDYADNVANGLILHPEKYNVILTTNLIGDILSDEGSALCGNLCAACNLSDDAAVYMPVSHIAPLDEQNLIRFFYPYLLCTARILADSGYTEQSKRLEKAVTNNFDLSLGVTEAGRNIKEAVLQ
jgi:isocitrate/isopropylmalate dehydrogenase